MCLIILSAKKTPIGSIWFQKTLKTQKAAFLTFLTKGQLISEGTSNLTKSKQKFFKVF